MTFILAMIIMLQMLLIKWKWFVLHSSEILLKFCTTNKALNKVEPLIPLELF